MPGQYLVVGALVASGGSLRWFRDQLGEAERLAAPLLGLDPFDLLSQEAARSPAGANGVIFLPYMFGERSPIWDSAARGVFFGLSLATKKADLVRAIMEGAAFGLRHNAETAAGSGFEIARLACVGGGAAQRGLEPDQGRRAGVRSGCRRPRARRWATRWRPGWRRASTQFADAVAR